MSFVTNIKQTRLVGIMVGTIGHQGKHNTMTFLRRLDLPNSIIKNETCNWNKNSFQHAIHKNVILSYLKQSMHGAVKIIYLD